MIQPSWLSNLVAYNKQLSTQLGKLRAGEASKNESAASTSLRTFMHLYNVPQKRAPHSLLATPPSVKGESVRDLQPRYICGTSSAVLVELWESGTKVRIALGHHGKSIIEAV